jgi:hypothetical protein
VGPPRRPAALTPPPLASPPAWPPTAAAADGAADLLQSATLTPQGNSAGVQLSIPGLNKLETFLVVALVSVVVLLTCGCVAPGGSQQRGRSPPLRMYRWWCCSRAGAWRLVGRNRGGAPPLYVCIGGGAAHVRVRGAWWVATEGALPPSTPGSPAPREGVLDWAGGRGMRAHAQSGSSAGG